MLTQETLDELRLAYGSHADVQMVLTEIERLQKALQKYGEHTSSDCAPMYGCSCGYLEALGIEPQE